MERLKALVELDQLSFSGVIVSTVDILIVVFVLYRLMLLIKGTRAVQLIKGLVVLMGATFLSRWLHLEAVHWLLQQAMTALVVALPVVFQPELRRTLEKLGGGKFLVRPFALMPERDRGALIDELTRAVLELARSRTGALVVLERNTGLEEYIDTGTRIDGLVTAELILNIFIPGSPLHDGAVVIRGNRLVAAACVLPLSENFSLARELGTRHRAAVGISEQSDALAVVVSEESGVISLAEEGELIRDLDEEGLRSRLKNALQPKGQPISSLWQRIS